jgi:hypothetical protein
MVLKSEQVRKSFVRAKIRVMTIPLQNGLKIPPLSADGPGVTLIRHSNRQRPVHRTTTIHF